MTNIKAKDVMRFLSQVPEDQPVFMPVLWLKEDIEDNWSVELSDEDYAQIVKAINISEYWYEEANTAVFDALLPYLPADSEWVAK